MPLRRSPAGSWRAGRWPVPRSLWSIPGPAIPQHLVVATDDERNLVVITANEREVGDHLFFEVLLGSTHLRHPGRGEALHGIGTFPASHHMSGRPYAMERRNLADSQRIGPRYLRVRHEKCPGEFVHGVVDPLIVGTS